MKEKLIKDKGIHTETDSLIEVRIGDQIWYNLCRGFRDNTFHGDTSIFTDIDEAIKVWEDEH